MELFCSLSSFTDVVSVPSPEQTWSCDLHPAPGASPGQSWAANVNDANEVLSMSEWLVVRGAWIVETATPESLPPMSLIKEIKKTNKVVCDLARPRMMSCGLGRSCWIHQAVCRSLWFCRWRTQSPHRKITGKWQDFVCDVRTVIASS